MTTKRTSTATATERDRSIIGSIEEYIKTQKDLLDKIISIETAKINDGGEGAIIIKLKKL